MRRLATCVTVLLVAVAAACSSSQNDVASCPNDLPSACPGPTAPSFASTIQPTLSSRCHSCHSEGGAAGTSHVFDTYDEVYSERRVMLNQIFACAMPPSSAEALSSDERAALLAWFVCGAPNN